MSFISGPASIYLLVSLIHVWQQLTRNQQLKTKAAPQTDFIVQGLVMAALVEIFYQNNLGMLSWILTAPAILVSVVIVFYMVMNYCTV